MIESWSLLSDLLPTFGVKLAVALVCGFIIGAERERKDKPAGLRTIVLITVGATLYMIVSDLITLTTRGPTSITRVDPSRIAAQVVTGIGFLGAGTIVQSRGSVHGLTTAATIWVAAGLGLCVGAGFPLFALGTTLVIVFMLVAMDPLRARLAHGHETHSLRFLVRDDTLTRRRVELLLRDYSIGEERREVVPYDEDRVEVCIHHELYASSEMRMLEGLKRIDGVYGLEDPD